MQIETRNFASAVLNAIPNAPAYTPIRAMIQSQLNQANIREQMYFQQVNILQLASGATSAATALTVQADAPFLIQAGMLWAVNHAALTGLTPNTRITPLVTVQLNDQGGPGLLQSAAVPVQNLFGVDGVPMAWPKQYLLQANTQMTITATNYDSALTYDLYFTFLGVKLFNAQS